MISFFFFLVEVHVHVVVIVIYHSGVFCRAENPDFHFQDTKGKSTSRFSTSSGLVIFKIHSNHPISQLQLYISNDLDNFFFQESLFLVITFLERILILKVLIHSWRMSFFVLLWTWFYPSILKKYLNRKIHKILMVDRTIITPSYKVWYPILFYIIKSLFPGSSPGPENVDINFSTHVFTKLALDLKCFHKYFENAYSTKTFGFTRALIGQQEEGSDLWIGGPDGSISFNHTFSSFLLSNTLLYVSEAIVFIKQSVV